MINSTFRFSFLGVLLVLSVMLSATAAADPTPEWDDGGSVSFDEAGDSAQMLIFPYFNVADQLITSFSIRNIKNESKILRFRFLESETSLDVLDFNVYMSPFDVFSVTLSKGGNGRTIISTKDTTCTFPLNINGAQFKDLLGSTDQSAFTNEGYLTVIEMGVLSNAGTPGVIINGGLNTLPALVKHVDHDNDINTPAQPPGCPAIAQYWGDGTFTQGGAVSNVSYNGGMTSQGNRSGYFACSHRCL